MKIIKNIKDAESIKEGDYFFIDVYPEPPITDAEVFNLDRTFMEAQLLEDEINQFIDRNINNGNKGNNGKKPLPNNVVNNKKNK